MDDLIIIHKNKEYLKRLLQELIQFAKCNLDLSFNAKTQIFPLHKGVSFLGWRFYYTKTNKIIQKISNDKRKIRISHIKAIKQEKNPLKYLERILSMWESLSKGNTNALRKRQKVIKPPLLKKKLSKMNEEKYLIGEIVGVIKKMSGVLNLKNGTHWGFFTVHANYNQIVKVKIFTD